jgi:hypothetical protein
MQSYLGKVREPRSPGNIAEAALPALQVGLLGQGDSSQETNQAAQHVFSELRAKQDIESNSLVYGSFFERWTRIVQQLKDDKYAHRT